MEFLTEDKLLTCILPKGLASDFLESLKDVDGVQSVDVASGRGIDGYKNSGDEWVEVDILSLVTTLEKAEDNFALLYGLAGIEEEPGRFMYMESLNKKGVMGSLDGVS
jgi:hypothetical protein